MSEKELMEMVRVHEEHRRLEIEVVDLSKALNTHIERLISSSIRSDAYMQLANYSATLYNLQLATQMLEDFEQEHGL